MQELIDLVGNADKLNDFAKDWKLKCSVFVGYENSGRTARYQFEPAYLFVFNLLKM